MGEYYDIHGARKITPLTLKLKFMKIKEGGQLESLSKEKKLEEIKVGSHNRTINLWLNDSSLSYLTLEEALDLRDELNRAISEATGIKK